MERFRDVILIERRFSPLDPCRTSFPSAYPATSPARAPIIALAASAGGLHALGVVLADLPQDFPAPILIAQHQSPDFASQLDRILGGCTPLCVHWAAEGERPRAGCVSIAPRGRHLLVCPDGTLSLAPAERPGLGRPSADLLFESLACCFGGRAVAVVLTGLGRDGARGVCAVRAAGGISLAQDEGSSQFPSMPRSAAETGAVDAVLPLSQIGPALTLLADPAGEQAAWSGMTMRKATP